MNFAIISEGIVVNTVVWDGEGDIFKDYTTVNIDGIEAGIGWSYSEGQFTAPPEEQLLALNIQQDAQAR